MIIVGTRPEIIRLAAVINKCRQYFDCLLAHTGRTDDKPSGVPSLLEHFRGAKEEDERSTDDKPSAMPWQHDMSSSEREGGNANRESSESHDARIDGRVAFEVDEHQA